MSLLLYKVLLILFRKKSSDIQIICQESKQEADLVQESRGCQGDEVYLQNIRSLDHHRVQEKQIQLPQKKTQAVKDSRKDIGGCFSSCLPETFRCACSVLEQQDRYILHQKENWPQ